MKALGRIRHAGEARQIRGLGDALGACFVRARGEIRRLAIERHAERAVGVGLGLEEQRPLSGEVAHHQSAIFPVADQRPGVARRSQNRARDLGAGLPKVQPPRHIKLRRVVGGSIHGPIALDLRDPGLRDRHGRKPLRPKYLRTCARAFVAIRAAELIALERRVERRVEEIPVEPQRAVFEAPRRRAHLVVALKEEALDLAFILRDLEAEWDLCMIGDDNRIPQPGRELGRASGSTPPRGRQA